MNISCVALWTVPLIATLLGADANFCHAPGPTYPSALKTFVATRFENVDGRCGGIGGRPVILDQNDRPVFPMWVRGGDGCALSIGTIDASGLHTVVASAFYFSGESVWPGPHGSYWMNWSDTSGGHIAIFSRDAATRSIPGVGIVASDSSGNVFEIRNAQVLNHTTGRSYRLENQTDSNQTILRGADGKVYLYGVIAPQGPARSQPLLQELGATRARTRATPFTYSFHIAIAPNGDVWVGHYLGIARYDAHGKMVQNVSTVVSFPCDITSLGTASYLAAGRDGDVWFFLRQQLWHLHANGELARMPFPGDFGIIDGTAAAVSGVLWISAETGRGDVLYRFVDETPVPPRRI